MSTSVILTFCCYRCEESLSITTRCRGFEEDDDRVVSVTVACPCCGQGNYLSFDQSGQVRSVRPYTCIRVLPAPSLN